MEGYTITKEQARSFMLRKQGLLGEYRFRGKEGILEYIRQAGCIQFDPIDVCGKNAELVLQSRIQGFTKEMLYELLYVDRLLVDYFDKNLAILPVTDWKYFERKREYFRKDSRSREMVDRVAADIKQFIAENGPVSSKELQMKEKVDWYWSSTNLSRAALETLYFRGELIIHHKKGTNKYYALAEEYIPREILTAPDPFPEDFDHQKWRVLRRISAVGLLWNRPSDAWLSIGNLKAEERKAVFASLLAEDKITEVIVEELKEPLYCLTEDLLILKEVLQASKEGAAYPPRTELMAALDNMLWDRKLIQALFGFDYKWEIYTPANERKYGYYVLPLLSNDQIIGRAELVCDRKNKVLQVRKVWFEEGIQVTPYLKKEIRNCFQRFQGFHGLNQIQYSDRMQRS